MLHVYSRIYLSHDLHIHGSVNSSLLYNYSIFKGGFLLRMAYSTAMVHISSLHTPTEYKGKYPTRLGLARAMPSSRSCMHVYF